MTQIKTLEERIKEKEYLIMLLKEEEENIKNDYHNCIDKIKDIKIEMNRQTELIKKYSLSIEEDLI